MYIEEGMGPGRCLMLQHCQWLHNEGPETHASLWNLQEHQEDIVFAISTRRLQRCHRRAINRLAVLVSADTDVKVFEPSQVI